MAKGHKPKSNPKLARNIQGALRKSGIPDTAPVVVGPYKKRKSAASSR